MNSKRVYRIYREEGLKVRVKRRKKLESYARVRPPAAGRVNERWSMDFVADALACVKEGLDSAFCPGLTPGNGALTAVEKVERAKILSCASTLDAYNNGYLLGPGHCEDDDLAAGLVAGVEGAEEEAQSTSPNGDSGMLVATLVFAIFACLAACLAAYAAMTKGPYAKV